MYNNEEGQEYFMEVEKEGQISYDEVKEAVNRIRTEKVPRGDGIYPELVRQGGPVLKNVMWQLFNHVLIK